MTGKPGTDRENLTGPKLHKVCIFEQTRLRHFVKLHPKVWEMPVRVGFFEFAARQSKGSLASSTHPYHPPEAGLPIFFEVSMARANHGLGRNLLCIDDSEAILQYEKSLFERSGFNVVTAASAPQGLRLATASSFDAVLLDYHMPEMNGHQIALEIRRIRPETLLVMFSGSEIPEETHKLVDAVIPKAGTIRDLLPTVARLCNRLSPA